MLIFSSYQATHANPQFEQDVQIHVRLRKIRLPKRRLISILRLVSNNTVHDRPLHRAAVPRLRIDIHRYESYEGI